MLESLGKWPSKRGPISNISRLNQLGYSSRLVEVNGGERANHDDDYYNRRAEMWAGMRDWIKTGCLPGDDQELADDLIAPEYGFDGRNRLQLEKKDDMKARGLPSPGHGGPTESIAPVRTVYSRSRSGRSSFRRLPRMDSAILCSRMVSLLLSCGFGPIPPTRLRDLAGGGARTNHPAAGRRTPGT